MSEPHTGGLSWPAWEPQPNFNIDAHVHRAALPAPGGEPELMEWVGEYWSHRLDRLKPLWDATLLEGLEDGRWALVTKTHHCMVDGVGSIDAGHLLLDTTPAPSDPPAETPPASEPHDPGPLLGRLPSALAGAARAGAGMALHPDLADHGTEHVVVADPHGRPVGVVSTRDIAAVLARR